MTNSQTSAEIESTNRMRETEEILLEASKVLRDEHTHTYKNIPLSGFLHRHESSIDLRERQVLVTGWLQSQDFTTASFEVRRCSTRCSLTSDGKANQHVSVGLCAAKSAKRRNSIIAALKMPNVVFYSLRSIYIQILEKNKYAMFNTIRASNYTVI